MLIQSLIKNIATMLVLLALSSLMFVKPAIPLTHKTLSYNALVNDLVIRNDNHDATGATNNNVNVVSNQLTSSELALLVSSGDILANAAQDDSGNNHVERVSLAWIYVFMLITLVIAILWEAPEKNIVTRKRKS